MGAIESKVGNLVQRLLMPQEAPAHFQSFNHFPEAPAGSLLLLAHIALEAHDGTQPFYAEGLGNGCSEDRKGNVGPYLCVHAGVTQLHLYPSGQPQRLAQIWPGHIYCWADDISALHDGCQSVCPSAIEEVHRFTDEKAIDALVLQDPEAMNQFVINQAPRGGCLELIKGLGSQLPGRKTGNLLAILDATHLIAPGTGEALKRCYEHFLGSAVSWKKGGYALNFSLGHALQQTLTFIEDSSVPLVAQDQLGKAHVPEICIYMASLDAFRTAFERCADAGLLCGTSGSWSDVEKASEFRFSSCLDPETREVVLELRHVVRVAQHANCPLPAGQVWQNQRNIFIETDSPWIELTLADVAKHNKTDDAWVVINGRVLDVTDWIHKHPWHLIMGDFGSDISMQWNIIHKQGTWEDQLAHPNGPRVVGHITGSFDLDDPSAGA